jgi:ferric-dicitrate binding protein FerR (iron transport regulator)
MPEESDLLRLIEGECSPDEAEAIQTWIAVDPGRARLLEDLRAVWRLTGGATSRDWHAVAARDRLLRARGLLMFPAARRFQWTAPWPTRIAVAIVCTTAGLLSWYLQPGALPPREYTTAAGHLSTLRLPDGSRVLLGVASRLAVPRDYGAGARVVDLDGEAYFAVQYDAAHPFIVRTRQGITEDLGTEFAVRAYRQEDQLQVVVASGQVALRGAARPESVLATLRARDRAIIGVSGAATVTRRVALEGALAWTRGMLLFDDVSVGSVRAQLERWYDVDIVTDDPSLDAERVTISFATKSADEAVRTLARVLGVRVTRAGRLVRLTAVHLRN